MSQKTILLPTDFSDNSKNAIEYAIALYKKDQCRFILMNGYYVPQAGATMLTSIDDILLKETNHDLKVLQKELLTAHKELEGKLEIRAIYGDATRAVLSILDNEEIDLIILGTKGATGLKEVFWGSNTASIVSKVSCPVIAVPENFRLTSLEKIAFATDFVENQSTKVLDSVVDIAEQHNAEVLIFNVKKVDGALVEEGEGEAEMKLHEDLDRVEHTFLYATENDIVEGIDKFIRRQKVDMLAMIARKHNFFHKLFYGSITQKVTMHIDIPLLVLHDDA